MNAANKINKKGLDDTRTVYIVEEKKLYPED